MSEDCLICCNSFNIFAEYQCGHRICYRCASKLIVFYKDENCCQCKMKGDKIVFSEVDSKTLYNIDSKTLYNLNSKPIYNSNSNNELFSDNIAFSSHSVKKAVLSLFKNSCNICKKSSKDLISHYKSEHKSFLCNICINENNSFSDEFVCFNPTNLILHKKEKHILCKFCKLFLYNLQKARIHGREEHQLCTICDILGIKNQYYSNYNSLEIHYRSMHHCCKDPICSKNHSYVFAHPSELAAHSKNIHKKETDILRISEIRIENPEVLDLRVESTLNYRNSGNDNKNLNKNVNENKNVHVNKTVNANKFNFETTNFEKKNFNSSIEDFPGFENNIETQKNMIKNGTFNNSTYKNETYNPFINTFNDNQIPNYLSRSIPHERLRSLQLISKSFYKQIDEVLNEFKGDENQLIQSLEEIADKKTVLKILEFNFKKESAISEKYRKELEFPKFEKNIDNKTNIDQKNNEKKIDKKKSVFKIIDLKKRM